MGWLAYIRQDRVFVPTRADTTDGLLIDIEPIEVADVGDADALRTAVAAVIGRGRQVVPARSPKAYQRSPLLTVAGVRTWAAFYKGTRQLGFMRGSTGFETFEVKRDERNPYYVVDESTRAMLPATLGMSEVVDRITAEIQRVARDPRRADSQV